MLITDVKLEMKFDGDLDEDDEYVFEIDPEDDHRDGTANLLA